MSNHLTTRSGRKIRLNTPEEEVAVNAGIAADQDNLEWAKADFERARPAAEFFDAQTSAGLVALSRRGRGPQKTPTKERITIRLSPEVVSAFRATGDGWQTRVDAALQDWLKTHSPAA